MKKLYARKNTKVRTVFSFHTSVLLILLLLIVPVCALAHAFSIYKSHSVFGTLVTHTEWQPQYCQYRGAL